VLVGDVVLPLPASDVEAGVVCVAATPTADTVTLRLANPTAGTVNGASKTWSFYIWRP
jgi:hypothetical protein